MSQVPSRLVAEASREKAGEGMWLGCLLALWAMAMVVFAFFLAVGLIIEAPWLLLVPALLTAWRWLRTLPTGRTK
jgi:hypothetical protein